MVNLVRYNLLASAIGVALIGAMSPMSSQAASGLDAATSTAVEVSSVGRYVITFAEPGLLYYRGDVQSLSATAPDATYSRKLDASSIASRNYSNYLSDKRNAHIATIEQALGRKLDIPHIYGVTKNGISAVLSVEEASRIVGLDGVVSVDPVRTYELDTFRGPSFIGADTIWSGVNTPTPGTGTRGQGIKVGIIDSGTNTSHPSFANDASCGFSTVNPKLFAKDCTTSSAGVCTGAEPNAIGSGHGVHTSSTAAGNTINNTVTPAPLLPDGVNMSGVAPCATIYSYKVCEGTCTGDAIGAAIESIVVDQLDVTNFSIGPTCGGGSPWSTSDSDRAFLDAVAGDVFIAASAGNTRTACTNPTGLVAHLAPWVLTVAASTQDQVLSPQVSVTGPGTPSPTLQNIGVIPSGTTVVFSTTDLTNFPLRTYPANLSGCTDTGAFPANYFRDAIAVIRRGFQAPGTTACSFVEKVNNATAAGARLVVVTNNQATALATMGTDGTTIPSFAIPDQTTGDALVSFVSANLGTIPSTELIFKDGFDLPAAPDGATANYKRAGISATQGDVLAGFSFRGPTSGNVADLTKPDITGPGVNIYAAGRTGDGSYYLESGTSMSSPHVAGAAALVRKLQPTWSVSEVKSAMQSTAKIAGFKEDGITSWDTDDVGSGRVDLTKAAKAGLTLNETTANFLAANPSGGSISVKALNLASMRDVACGTTCSWTRTVRNRLTTTGTWNVTFANPTGYTLSASPSNFTLAPGATQTITITATPPAGTQASIAFGNVLLTEAANQSPQQHLTVAVKKAVSVPPGVVTLQADSFSGTGNFNLLGSATASPPLQFLWLNRFTPAPTSFPFTLNTIQTVFAGSVASVPPQQGTVLGELFDFYIYQDSDTNPANGATLIGSMVSVPVTTQNAFQTITIPGGLAITGSGDILIGVVNRGRQGYYPASADVGPNQARSWISGINVITAGPPNLATISMQLTTAVVPTFTYNWIIRGNGTTTTGAPVVLDNSVGAGN
jgi:subtilisin family serine protease